MSLIRIPLPRPISHVRVTSHQQEQGGNGHSEWDEDTVAHQLALSELAAFSVAGGDSVPVTRDYEMDNSVKSGGGDEIRLKALKHRILYLEQSLQSARDEAFKAGFAEAERIYLDRQEQELNRQQADFSRLQKSLHLEYENLPDQLGPVVTEIIFRSVRIIVGEILLNEEHARQVVSHQVRGCLDRLVDQTEIRITIAPEQFQWLKTSQELDTFKQSTSSRVVVGSDPGLNPGECRVESDDFVLDGTLERQLANLRFDQSTIEPTSMTPQTSPEMADNE